MRIAFLVNQVETEIDEYATTRLAKAAALMGHEVWYVGLGDLRIGEPDGEIGAHARPGASPGRRHADGVRRSREGQHG